MRTGNQIRRGPPRRDRPRGLRPPGRAETPLGSDPRRGTDQKLLGIFTDSDLARLFEKRREAEPTSRSVKS